MHEYKLGPAFKIGKGKRIEVEIKSIAANPGIGSYNNVNYEKYKSSSIKSTITKASRFPTEVYGTVAKPGPGNYEHRSYLGSGPKYSTRSKLNQTSNQFYSYETPGPGHYSIKKDNIQTNLKPKFTFSKIEEIKDKKINDPGPGHYNTTLPDTKIENTKESFPTEKRQYLVISTNPGPADYNNDISKPTNRKSDIPRESKMKYLYLKSVRDSPGPGQYKLNSTISNISAKLKSRTSSCFSTKSNVPGPGSYGGEYYSSNKRVKKNSYSMGKEERFGPTKLSSPGPADYKMITYSPDSPGFKIGKANRSGGVIDQEYKEKMDVSKSEEFKVFKPNYGKMASFTKDHKVTCVENKMDKYTMYYSNDELITNAKSPSFSFSTVDRNPFDVKNSYPGPSTYTYNDKNNRKIKTSFGRDRKILDVTKNNYTPGPGTYKIPNTVGVLTYFEKN